MPLSDTRIKSLKAGDKPVRHLDSEGLYLLVHPNGSKYWQYRYSINSKRRMMGLGQYPDISLADARELRNAARKTLAAGADPMTAREEKRAQASAAANNSFESVARDWWKLQAGRWKPAHAQRIIQSLEHDAFPALGALPINSITRAQVLACVRQIEERDALDTASRVLQRISAVYRYALLLEKCSINPAADLSELLKPAPANNYRHLTAAELPGFLRAIESYNGRYLSRLAMRLMMLTFVRTYELRHAEWEHVDIQAREWRIPPRYMKMKRLHVVPLSQQAVAVIEKIRPITGSSPFLFPNERNPVLPMSDGVLLKMLEALGYKDCTTVHGIRATASTVLNEQGWPADVIERQLSHLETNSVRAAYNHAEYLQERVKMMQWWADYLEEAERNG